MLDKKPFTAAAAKAKAEYAAKMDKMFVAGIFRARNFRASNHSRTLRATNNTCPTVNHGDLRSGASFLSILCALRMWFLLLFQISRYSFGFEIGSGRQHLAIQIQISRVSTASSGSHSHSSTQAVVVLACTAAGPSGYREHDGKTVHPLASEASFETPWTH